MSIPSMYFGDSSRRGKPYAKDPAVVRFGGRYLLYYSLSAYTPELRPEPNPAGNGWGIGIAESADRDNWRKIGEIHPEQPCEANGICAPGAVVLDGRVHLFYQTYGNGPKDALCHAVSEDGIRFERDPSNPVFAPTGDWNNGRAIDADVVPWRGELLLFFSTRDPSGTVQMSGVASAPLPEAGAEPDFGRSAWRQRSEASILKPTLPWERNCIEAAAVCIHDDRLWMFYGGGYNNEPQQVGCAVCPDGDPTRWERVSDEPVLPNGEPGTWNASESGHPFVFTDEDGSQHLFYQGNSDNGETWLLSRLPIRWTEHGPVVLP